MSPYRTLTEAAAAAGALAPAPRQLAWQETEYNAFLHFTVNTFTDREWGLGTEDPGVFQPSALDARQWVRVCKDAGMRIVILTAKHHDGFCLWPSRHTRHSVSSSPWRSGTGDVVGELATACREAGLKLGLYLSPWDRNSALYGTSEYNAYLKDQLAELLTNYGPIAEMWFDGACGEGPNGKRQVYDWAAYYEVIRRHQPGAMIAICGPDARWVGNEEGLARETEWSVLGVDGDLARPGFEDWNERFYHHLRSGTQHKSQPGELESLLTTERLWYWPSEVDVSIRPGWFYHPAEDLQVRSLERLVDIYYRSAGRNNVLLLNLPPDRRGLIHEHDAARLRELRAVLDATFDRNLAAGRPVRATSAAAHHPGEMAVDGNRATCWAPEPADAEPTLEVDLGSPTAFNRLMLQEMIAEGQRVATFVLEAWHDGAWKPVTAGTTIGHKRLDRFGEVVAQRIRLRITGARATPMLRTFGIYRAALGG